MDDSNEHEVIVEGDDYDLTVFTVIPEDAGEYRATFALDDAEFGAAHLVDLSGHFEPWIKIQLDCIFSNLFCFQP